MGERFIISSIVAIGRRRSLRRIRIGNGSLKPLGRFASIPTGRPCLWSEKQSFHLVLQTPQANLVAGMQWFTTVNTSDKVTSLGDRQRFQMKPSERQCASKANQRTAAASQKLRHNQDLAEDGSAAQAGKGSGHFTQWKDRIDCRI